MFTLTRDKHFFKSSNAKGFRSKWILETLFLFDLLMMRRYQQLNVCFLLVLRKEKNGGDVIHHELPWKIVTCNIHPAERIVFQK